VTASLVGYAIAPAWWVVVACAVAGGLGAGAIDTGINTFAASHFSPRVVNWLHASWGVGASAGPLLMTAVLATHHGWRPGYGILAVAMLGLCALFAVTSALWRDDGATEDAPRVADETEKSNDRDAQAVTGLPVELVNKLREIVRNTENVGHRFPEEARKIHYEEVPARPIRGQATKDDADALREEGIDFTSLPPFLTRDPH